MRTTKTPGQTLAHNNVACDTSADQILAANLARKGFTIQATDGTVYIGGSGVTTSTGFPLAAGQSFSSDGFAGAVYGITASGTVNVRYWEES